MNDSRRLRNTSSLAVDRSYVCFLGLGCTLTLTTLHFSLVGDVTLGDVEMVTVDPECELLELLTAAADGGVGGVGAGLFLRVRIIGFGLSGRGLKIKIKIFSLHILLEPFSSYFKRLQLETTRILRYFRRNRSISDYRRLCWNDYFKIEHQPVLNLFFQTGRWLASLDWIWFRCRREFYIQWTHVSTAGSCMRFGYSTRFLQRNVKYFICQVHGN